MEPSPNLDSGAEIEQFAEIFARLASPFVHAKKRPGRSGQQYDYIDSTMVMNRLDDAVGPGRWNDSYEVIDSCVYCRITIYLPDGSKVTRGDASGYDIRKEGDKQDRPNSLVKKTAFSDAFKRAAMKFGVGRYLRPGYRKPMYYARVADRVRKSQDAAVAPGPAPAAEQKEQPFALDNRPAPSKPPTPDEFPSRRGPIVKPGAILFRILSNPPYDLDGTRAHINEANWFSQETGAPAKVVDWRIEHIRDFWQRYMSDHPFPPGLAKLLPHAAPTGS